MKRFSSSARKSATKVTLDKERHFRATGVQTANRAAGNSRAPYRRLLADARSRGR